MTLTFLKVQLTSHLCEMASTNSYETRDKALKLLDAAYNLGVSDSTGASGASSGAKPATSKPSSTSSRSPSRD